MQTTPKEKGRGCRSNARPVGELERHQATQSPAHGKINVAQEIHEIESAKDAISLSSVQQVVGEKLALLESYGDSSNLQNGQRGASSPEARQPAQAGDGALQGEAQEGPEVAGQTGETFSLRKGASVNSQKKLIPKTAEKMPRFQSRGTFEEVRSQVVDWMKDNPTAVTPDGKTILINNPENGSLGKRAEHWMGSYAKDDPWRKGGRNPRPDKLESIAAIPATISGAQAEALATSGKTVYLRRYADDKLHAVFVDRENRVTEHGIIDGSVVTQYTLDPRKGIEGAKIVHDWTTESPAYSVNPVKGAESDRVMTPGPQPMDQQNGTPSPSAHKELTANGEIVNSAETHSLRTPFKAADFITKSFNERIDQWEKTGEAGRDFIVLGKTPPVLRVAGADDLAMIVPPSLFDKVTKGEHSIPIEALRSLPQSLADPVAVFQSRRDGDAILVLTEFDEPGKGPVVVAVHLNRKSGRNLEVNQIVSMYGKPDAEIAKMFSEQPLYINPQKSLARARQAGKQYSRSGTPSQGKESIPGPAEVVKWAEAKLAERGATLSLRSGDFASRMEAAFSPFKRSPELRLAIAQVAKQRAQIVEVAKP